MKLNKSNLSSVILMALLFTFSYSCKKDKDSTPSILGSWVMNIGIDNNIPIQISFFANGFYEWIPLVPTENHTRSSAEYTLSDGVLTLINDSDCPEEGRYLVSIDDNKLILTVQQDDCPSRVAGLEGSWSRKNDLIDIRVQGVWYRSISIADTLREIVFFPQQNGVFEWIISKETPDYQTTNGRYAIGEDYMVIFNFLDCTGLGYYTYDISEVQLKLTEAAEPCSIRSVVMAGTWELEQN